MTAEPLIVLTGPPGSGKTTCCRALAAAAVRRGLAVRGLLAVVEPGVRGGAAPVAAPRAAMGAAALERWVEDLGGGERRLLGRETPLSAANTGDLRWSLCDDTLAWGNDVLRDACPTDLLIVDEVGPVELLHRRGWLAGLQQALGGRYHLAVVVVRPWLVPRFQQMQLGTPSRVVDVRHADGALAHEILLESMGGATGCPVTNTADGLGAGR